MMKIKMQSAEKVVSNEMEIEYVIQVKYWEDGKYGDFKAIGCSSSEYYAQMMATGLRMRKNYTGKRRYFKDVRVFEILKNEQI